MRMERATQLRQQGRLRLPWRLRQCRARHNNSVDDFLVALGLVLVIEGVLYGGLPNLARRLAAEVLSTPEQALRTGGLVAAAIGVGIIWLVRT